MVEGMNRVQADHALHGTSTKTIMINVLRYIMFLREMLYVAITYGMVCAYFSGIKSGRAVKIRVNLNRRIKKNKRRIENVEKEI